MANKECTSETLKRIIQKIAGTKDSMLNQYSISMVPIYIEMADVLQMFIKTERIG